MTTRTKYKYNTLSPLGTKIRALRLAKGYTYKKVAELTNSSRSYMWEFENKEPPCPSADKIAKIAAALGVTIDYLLDTSDNMQVEDAIDAAFFRKYRSMDSTTKDKIRQLISVMCL